MNGWSEVDERLREHCLITSASAAVSRHTTHTCLNDQSLANEPTGRQTGSNKSNKAVISVLQEPVKTNSFDQTLDL